MRLATPMQALHSRRTQQRRVKRVTAEELYEWSFISGLAAAFD